MPEPTTAPVTEGLRERVEVSFGPAMRMGLQDAELHGERGTQRIEEWITAITDAVLAALAGDPGDLRERLVRAMHAVVVCDPTEAVTIRALAAAALSVRWEDHAATLARLAQAEARVAELEAEQVAASEEVFQLMAHTDETCSVVADRDRAVAEAERLRAELDAVGELYVHACRGVRERESVRAERDALKAAIERVRVLHFTRGRNIHGDDVCNECSPLQPMPCPTLATLAVPESTPSAEEATGD